MVYHQALKALPDPAWALVMGGLVPAEAQNQDSEALMAQIQVEPQELEELAQALLLYPYLRAGDPSRFWYCLIFPVRRQGLSQFQPNMVRD